jgi:hypothetical protein
MSSRIVDPPPALEYLIAAFVCRENVTHKRVVRHLPATRDPEF